MRPDPLFAALQHHAAQQGLLGGVVGVDRALGHAGPRRDLRHGGAGDALLQKNGQRGFGDLALRLCRLVQAGPTATAHRHLGRRSLCFRDGIRAACNSAQHRQGFSP